MIINDLTTQGARASAAITLTHYSQIFRFQPQEVNLGVVSLTFQELFQIIERKFTMAEITFMVRISSCPGAGEVTHWHMGKTACNHSHHGSLHLKPYICTAITQKYIHYGDVIMGVIASQITSLTVVYPTVYSDADKRKHQSSAPRHWPLWGEFTVQMASNVEIVYIWWRHHVIIEWFSSHLVYVLSSFWKCLT